MAKEAAKEASTETPSEQPSTAVVEKEPEAATSVSTEAKGTTEDAAAAPQASSMTAPDEDKELANGEDDANGTSDLPENDPEDALSPAEGFQKARQVVNEIHSVLDKLSACKQSGDAEIFSSNANELQRLLLAMRRTHRMMVRAGDQGRAAEATARRKVDMALAHVETRQYESGCLRSAARRCRSFPTPELDKLRPNLRELSDADDSQDEEISKAASGLAKRLEAERKEREELDAKLEELEKVKTQELDVIREMQTANSELANLLRTGLQGLEPAMDKIVLQSRPSSAPQPDGNVLNNLPGCLQLVFVKFENIATFSEDSGLVVNLEGAVARGDGEPAEKKARKAEESGNVGMSVCVEITSAGKGATSKQTFGLRFTAPGGAIIHVAPKTLGTDSDALLESLWPEDNGSKTVEPAGCAESPGKAFYWAQVLAGLRGTVTTSFVSPNTMEFVSAMDIVSRVQAKLGAK
jgi:hypothetical protein